MNMTPEELKEILEKHALWLKDNKNGKRADLRGANLSYADLSYADLSYADLHSADLSYADLSCADLHSADLHSADLHSANLHSADLHSADLHSANLRGADLHSANLRGADLSDADIDYTAFKLSCSFTNFKMDGAGVGQLLFHALNIAEYSGIDIKSIEDVYALVKQSTPITKHGLNLKALEEKP